MFVRIMSLEFLCEFGVFVHWLWEMLKWVEMNFMDVHGFKKTIILIIIKLQVN